MPVAIATASAVLLASAPSQAAGGPLFACGFGAKRVSVTGTPGALTYRFGTAAKAEMTLSGGAASRTVFQKIAMYPRAMNTHLRFAQGEFSYVLFHREYFGTATHEGAEDKQGLLVLKGSKLLARMICKTGQGFGEDVDLSALPQDDAFELADHM